MTEQEQGDADYVLSVHYKRDGDFLHTPPKRQHEPLSTRHRHATYNPE